MKKTITIIPAPADLWWEAENQHIRILYMIIETDKNGLPDMKPYGPWHEEPYIRGTIGRRCELVGDGDWFCPGHEEDEMQSPKQG